MDKSWQGGLLKSVLIHLVLIAGIALFWRIPMPELPAPKALKSYLVYEQVKPEPTPEPIQQDITVEEEPINEPEQELKESAEEPQNVQEQKVVEPQPRQEQLSSQPQMTIPSFESVQEMLMKNALNQDVNYDGWLKQQLPKLEGKRSHLPADFKPYIENSPGIKELAQSADGSRLIQVQGNCFNVKLNEKQEGLWMVVACPNSADPMRKAFRKSMAKFNLK